MTQLSYTIVLDDPGMSVVECAVAFYAMHCRSQIPDGQAKCPYTAHLRALERVQKALVDSQEQTFRRWAATPLDFSRKRGPRKKGNHPIVRS